MSEREDERARKSRLRWLTLGEAIAIAALVVSGLGLWNEWRKSNEPAAPATVVEERKPIPLTLRGKAADDGRRLEISPVESSHALESLTVTIKGAAPIEVGSDGRLDSDAVERALTNPDKDAKGRLSVPVRITARYVEAGADKSATGSYRLSYKWEGGGLFGGRSLRLIGLTRA